MHWLIQKSFLRIKITKDSGQDFHMCELNLTTWIYVTVEMTKPFKLNNKILTKALTKHGYYPWIV